jgi:hypothetical protein
VSTSKPLSILPNTNAHIHTPAPTMPMMSIVFHAGRRVVAVFSVMPPLYVSFQLYIKITLSARTVRCTHFFTLANRGHEHFSGQSARKLLGAEGTGTPQAPSPTGCLWGATLSLPAKTLGLEDQQTPLCGLWCARWARVCLGGTDACKVCWGRHVVIFSADTTTIRQDSNILGSFVTKASPEAKSLYAPKSLCFQTSACEAHIGCQLDAPICIHVFLHR